MYLFRMRKGELQMNAMLERVAQWLFKPRLRAWTRSTKQQDIDPPRELSHLRPGYVSVVNNQIIVTDPDAEQPYATLTIPRSPWLTVTLNGRPTVGRVVVRSSQQLGVELHPTPVTRTLTHFAAVDGMSVTVRVQVTPGVEYRLQEVHQVHHVVLEMVMEVLDPPPMEEKEIHIILQSAGYQGEVDEEAVIALAHAKQTTERVVLRGRPAIPGKPARYRPVRLPQVYDPIHRRMGIATISQGTTVAIFEPATDGIPGVDVFGKEVAVPQIRKLPKLGEGVMEVAGEVIALRGGRLLLTPSKIDVVPELIIQHDLTGKDGRVEFDGDVRIVGSVLEGGFVQATGTVTVRDGVFNATVLGEQGVFVGGSIAGCQVVAGQSRILFSPLHTRIQEFLREFAIFQKEYAELQDHVHSRGGPEGSSVLEEKVPLLADLLLNQRHPNLSRALDVLAEDKAGLAELDDRYREIVWILRKKWLGAGRTNIHQEDILDLQQLLMNYKAYLEATTLSQVADIKVSSINSSSVRCTGKMMVSGAGVYNSVLEAKNSITVQGIVRGGMLTAGQSVDVHELGSPSGTDSTVKVLSPSGKIAVQVRHPNTLLQVDNLRQRNFEIEYHVLMNQKEGSGSPEGLKRIPS